MVDGQRWSRTENTHDALAAVNHRVMHRREHITGPRLPHAENAFAGEFPVPPTIG